jgi:hypothetical protein
MIIVIIVIITYKVVLLKSILKLYILLLFTVLSLSVKVLYYVKCLVIVPFASLILEGAPGTPGLCGTQLEYD